MSVYSALQLLKYTHAVVCRIPTSLETKSKINIEEARKQHEAFVKLLRELYLDVIELPADESLPECGFVEDTAIVCNGIALMTKPDSAVRQKEVEIIKHVLKKEIGLTVMDIDVPNAKLHGGDVLFTGREFFIGLSTSTNEAGAMAVAEAFPEFPCTIVKVPDGTRLKHHITLAGPDLLSVGSGDAAREVLHRVQREASFQEYMKITVPEDCAANVLYINGTIVHRSETEAPHSYQLFCDKIDYHRRSLSVSELSAASCGLTSCCLLVRKTRHI